MFFNNMIIFNTIKSAEHYVKWCHKNKDYSTGGYDYRIQTTYIQDNMVLESSSGDSCGCGCDNYRYYSVRVIGRIKSYNKKTIRHNKINNLLNN